MCQFCVQHGDGKAWYLQASTYAYDLDSDLKRRAYLVEGIRDFAASRESALKNLKTLNKLPAPLQRLGSSIVSSRLQKGHFGQPVPIEECAAILDLATSVVRIPCPCRYTAGNKSDGYCLALTTKPIDGYLEEGFAGYDLGPDTQKFERLTKQQTMALLRRTEEEGLMHSVWTFLTPYIATICNCSLDAGCMAMRITIEHKTPIMFKGHYLAEADLEQCTGCADCVERCPFDAITIGPHHKRAVVDAEKCYGCGVCRSACENDALRLVAREGAPTGLLVPGAVPAPA